MDKSNTLKELYEITNGVSNKLVHCDGCTKCCESGLVYVLFEEISHLSSIGVPLIKIEGIHYIKRKSRGECSMLDKQHSKCSIYEDRPLSCRLFPLDLFSRNGKSQWGIYDYCPKENVKPIILRNGKPELDLEQISILSDLIDRNLPQRIFDFLIYEDKITAQIELLDPYKDEIKFMGQKKLS